MDFDAVTFEDLFQFSPEPSQTTEGEDLQASASTQRTKLYDNISEGQNQQANNASSSTSVLETEFHDLQAQLTQLQNAGSGSSGGHEYDQLRSHVQAHTSNSSMQAPYINYPQDDIPKSKNWIEVPKPKNSSSSLHVGSDGSTICVGSSGSTASFEEQYASSLPGNDTFGSAGGDHQPVVRRRRGGRGGGQPPDETYKLERSRQSARECRARKKLRYQYLDDIILERERANIVLKQELEKYVSWCTELDKGRLPEGWNEFIKSPQVKEELSTDDY